MFWVISVYFNIRNTLPKYFTFLLGHPVYEFIVVIQNPEDKLQKSVYIKVTGKCKSVPLQAWSGPEGSRNLRFPDFMTTAQEVGKVVSLMHRPPLPPGNIPGTEAESTPGP